MITLEHVDSGEVEKLYYETRNTPVEQWSKETVAKIQDLLARLYNRVL